MVVKGIASMNEIIIAASELSFMILFEIMDVIMLLES